MNGTDTWTRRFFPCPQAAVQLVCLPHAGGSAPFYRPVAQALHPRIEVLAVQYPGRQDRLREPMVDNLPDLADRIARVLASALDRPYAIFGHSMGATLAYEVGVRLEAAGRPPLHVFASGRRAPSRHRDESVHRETDVGIIAELRRLAGTDGRVFGDEELVRMVMPAIRNDYRAAETYRFTGGPKLRCPVTALAGDADPKASLDEVISWADHTEGAFELIPYQGGHFYLLDHAAAVIAVIADRLAAATAPATVPVAVP